MQTEKLPQQDFLSWNFESLKGGRSENQDFYGYCETPDGSRLFIVCDGMGGMRGGSAASREAVRVIIEEASRSHEPDPERMLTQALKKANTSIFQLGQSKEELRGMGTTVVALHISKEKATAAHVGDSRIYQLRGKQKVFRTFDHSVVFEMVKQGMLTEEQARLSPDSNLISRALGIKPEVEPEINGNLPYRAGDRFMLCTDGISGPVEEQRLLTMIASKKPVEKTTKEIAAAIDAMGVEAGGGHDNLTLALIDVQANSKIKPVSDKKKTMILIIVIFLLLLLLISIGLNIYAYL